MGVEWFWTGRSNSLREFDAQSGATINTNNSTYWQIECNGGNDYVQKTVTTRVDYYIGLWWYPTYIVTNNNPTAICFRDGTAVHCNLIVTQLHGSNYGRLCATRGTTPTVLQYGTYWILENAWHWIEMYVKIDDSVGRFVVKVNGTPDIDFTGDTRNAASAQITNMIFGNNACNYSKGYSYYGAIMIRDDQWAGNPPIYSPSYQQEVNANGTTNDWTASAGSNYACVGDQDDTDYVYSNTNDHIDLYTAPDLGADATEVSAVKVVASARKQGASAIANLQLALRSGGTNYFSASKALPTDYGIDVSNIWNVDPADSASWTPAKVNALEAGFKAVT